MLPFLNLPILQFTVFTVACVHIQSMTLFFPVLYCHLWKIWLSKVMHFIFPILVWFSIDRGFLFIMWSLLKKPSIHKIPVWIFDYLLEHEKIHIFKTVREEGGRVSKDPV